MTKLHDKNFLIVDDEDAILEVLDNQMEILGLKNRHFANSGNKGYDFFRNNHVDVIISDVRMADGNGVDLVEKIRASDKEMPLILFVSGFSDYDVDFIYDLGVDAVFVKPVKFLSILKFLEHRLVPVQERLKPNQKYERYSTLDEISLTLDVGISEADPKIVNIGRGGMFLALNEQMPELGDQLSFKITMPTDSIPRIMEGMGIVRWRRTSAKDAPRGVGIEFMELSEESLKGLLAILNQHKIQAFIPSH